MQDNTSRSDLKGRQVRDWTIVSDTRPETVRHQRSASSLALASGLWDTGGRLWLSCRLRVVRVLRPLQMLSLARSGTAPQSGKLNRRV